MSQSGLIPLPRTLLPSLSAPYSKQQGLLRMVTGFSSSCSCGTSLGGSDMHAYGKERNTANLSRKSPLSKQETLSGKWKKRSESQIKRGEWSAWLSALRELLKAGNPDCMKTYPPTHPILRNKEHIDVYIHTHTNMYVSLIIP